MSPARLVVRLTPRAVRDRIDGWTTDAEGRPVLLARVAAPPTDGRANTALERLIATALGLAPSQVRLAAGGKSRVKVLQLDGVDEPEIRASLAPP
jgi:uncharacterized protein YggU (UPF0235/DUF167 family)